MEGDKTKGLMSLSFIGLLLLGVIVLGCTHESNKIIVDSNNCDIIYNVKANTVLNTCKIHLHCENITNIVLENNIFDCNGTIHITLNNSREVWLSGNSISANLNIIDSENLVIKDYDINAPISFRNKKNHAIIGDEQSKSQ